MKHGHGTTQVWDSHSAFAKNAINVMAVKGLYRVLIEEEEAVINQQIADVLQGCRHVCARMESVGGGDEVEGASQAPRSLLVHVPHLQALIRSLIFCFKKKERMLRTFTIGAFSTSETRYRSAFHDAT